MQLIGNSETARKTRRRSGGTVTLVDLAEGCEAMLEELDLPEEISRRLMELGFVPGHSVVAGRCAPGGDPRVFRVDGTEVALRRDMASRIRIRATETPSPTT